MSNPKPYYGIKILNIDIETAPNKAYVWGLFKQNVGINQIVEPGYTLCFAAKWEHEDDVIFSGLFMNSMEEMLGLLWDLLDEADVVVHYNGKRFDIPTINREFVKHGLLPPSPYYQIDLYWVVRSNFRFASNKLDFVARELGLGTKVQHKGMELWRDCMDALEFEWGDEIPLHMWESWEVMEEYNKGDVYLLEKLYRKLQPWIKGHPNRALWMEPAEDGKHICPSCGSTNLRFKGYKRTKVLGYKQYRCNDCGTYPRERRADDAFKARKDVLT